ncbi:unnamed protein product [Echinostoma caproni]|uniref:Ubiquitin carboxyl-terminal hydrolase n=1 Tax=Echinostoma caproni TaxID=27848 RepID=A0A3P8HMY5_9TREM|nr:unnamed protein product [Echinostoma caproni]
MVTDMGLINEPNVVWEALSDVDGNTQFADSMFSLYTPSTAATNWEYPPSANSTSDSTSSSTPVAKAVGHEAPGATKSLGASATAMVKSALLRTFAGSGSAATAGSNTKKEVKPSPQWMKEISVTELARACSKQLSVEGSSDQSLSPDLSIAARLQLEEIESANSDSRVIIVKPEEVAKRASEMTSHTSLSADNLKDICSEDILEQAKKELGSGSDLDLALQLQFEGVQQMQQASPSPLMGVGTRAAVRPTPDTVHSLPSSVNPARPNSAVSANQRGRFTAPGPKTSSSVTVSTDRTSDEEKVSE